MPPYRVSRTSLLVLVQLWLSSSVALSFDDHLPGVTPYSSQFKLWIVKETCLCPKKSRNKPKGECRHGKSSWREFTVESTGNIGCEFAGCTSAARSITYVRGENIDHLIHCPHHGGRS